uniref:Transmembrane protein n=1 Tax=Parastrongyloides trichosuri TaxID=131310 RepID=A0A0N4Z4X7_PARTI
MEPKIPFIHKTIWKLKMSDMPMSKHMIALQTLNLILAMITFLIFFSNTKINHNIIYIDKDYIKRRVFAIYWRVFKRDVYIVDDFMVVHGPNGPAIYSSNVSYNVGHLIS